jgi:cytochrome P450
MKTLADMPGPAAPPILGVSHALRTRPLSFLQEVAAKYGGIAALPLVFRRVVFVSEPDHIEHVLQKAHYKYVNSPRVRQFGLLLGNGLLVSDGEYWRHQRGIVQSALRAADQNYYAEVVSQVARQRVEDWRRLPDESPLDVFGEMSAVTMTVICRTMFGRDFQVGQPEVVAAFRETMRFLQRRWLVPVRVPMWVPTPDNRAFRRNKRIADEIVYSLVAEARTSGNGCGDRGLLSILLNMQSGKDELRITDREVRDELMTILLAGYDTTATALSWTLYLLSLHPDVLRRVQGEVDMVPLNGLSADGTGRELQYTVAVLRESMRLYPPVWALTRLAVVDDTLGEYTLPEGTTVLISPYVTHRLEQIWPRPLNFDPDRFLGTDPPRFAFFPFGGGPRTCVGMSFAMMEARTVLATILQRYIPQPPDFPPVPAPQITMPPHRLLMRFRRR